MGLAWDLWGGHVLFMADMADEMGWDWHGTKNPTLPIAGRVGDKTNKNRS